MPSDSDARWLAAAARLAQRGIPLSRPNPAVGALIVSQGQVIARGWTQPGGRPHAEAIALDVAGPAAKGATLYVTLEPCAHRSPRGPACADLVAASGLARVVVGCGDPDPRTAGQGLERIRAAGIAAQLVENAECRASLAGYLCQRTRGRPHVTLKLALSEDGHLAPPEGEGQWLTGAIARAHTHAWRARMDAILVGRGTLEADQPRLDVRLPGLAERSPQRWLLTHGAAPDGWQALASPQAIAAMEGVQYLMVEGGAQAAQAFLAADLVDRLLVYRAPRMVGGPGPALPELALPALAASAHWQQIDTRPLGKDTLEVYEPAPCLPA
ncbi:bifunctional diaminohydroxyphosphoribosylaminopyrimidine deaminase/5-amino-6-(5-phosphoribosylamino)uracil reductase RibD [Novosphingobium sp.]|uniref:bifunctional diaminohydroxyphosphoribosylaminopyrimidine deaminase/5-amino-6-(5-phosphoribosylamino)uracil reductase RibD n=1 Tax=Novosphingobium sp. TaxID=1874826 RepID=UPI0025F5E097|nr:bifunctional diaminohydroxyphosphoribosylaminopyrimidine deaminase/5-amino-6-(5-phosphoribosylamino)uracil reductase RibD [Novosphingobium sp.]MCC6924409.1 bifunctional diaminohydroxyphosphoribosylaminopyrimidine deaminase/5-amino-6-(5-phosphoribosylamino)uracil reductase RibD [Novosphingobium sp.]